MTLAPRPRLLWFRPARRLLRLHLLLTFPPNLPLSSCVQTWQASTARSPRLGRSFRILPLPRSQRRQRTRPPRLHRKMCPQLLPRRTPRRTPRLLLTRGPVRPVGDTATTLGTRDVEVRFTSMASTVSVRLVDPVGDPAHLLTNAERIFREVERTCTRFDPSSDLMRANATADDWSQVAPVCLEVLSAAHTAYTRTHGVFDPRVLRTMESLGYDRSWDCLGTSATSHSPALRTVAATAWEPEFDHAASRVRLGPHPVDLGGIGKGFAVGRALESLRGFCRAALVEAGGDLGTFGAGPERTSGDTQCWRAQVEDPRGGTVPLAVLDVSDAAAATSSIRLRRWKHQGREVHHLIDPASGHPASTDLLAVTVLHEDAEWAEVWAKTLFVAGASGIASLAESESLAAYWVGPHSEPRASSRMRERIMWEAGR